MSTSFASLLRSSRLATYDRTIGQVYTTPLKHKKTGDWGLKRNLPTVIRTRYVTIEQLDTAEHQTPWQPGDSKVLFVKRWKENFPDSKRPVPRADKKTYNIVEMTPADFNRFLDTCSAQAPEFQQLLKKKKIVPDQLFEYLNVTFATSPAEKPVGPTYSDFTTEGANSVEGRILNSTRHGHAVGVAGVVAYLPKEHTTYLRQLGDKKVRTFYVESAHIDPEGKPHVRLTMNSSGNVGLPFMMAFDENQSDNIFTKPNLFLTRRESIGNVKEDNIIANPDHENLMSRITNLINKK